MSEVSKEEGATELTCGTFIKLLQLKQISGSSEEFSNLFQTLAQQKLCTKPALQDLDISDWKELKVPIGIRNVLKKWAATSTVMMSKSPKLILPKKSKYVGKKIALKDLEEKGILKKGTKVFFHYKKKKYFGKVEEKNGEIILVYSHEGKEVTSQFPGKWVSMIVESESHFGWDLVHISSNGSTLKQLKEQFRHKIVVTELLEIPDVLAADTNIFCNSSGHFVHGFRVWIDQTKDLEIMKTKFPILDDDSILLLLEDSFLPKYSCYKR